MTSDADRIWMDQWMYIHDASCRGKKQHKTRREAKRHRDSLDHADRMDIYRCRFCGCFHIGHRERNKEHEHDLS